jgi:hypothetical protein
VGGARVSFLVALYAIAFVVSAVILLGVAAIAYSERESRP